MPPYTGSGTTQKTGSAGALPFHTPAKARRGGSYVFGAVLPVDGASRAPPPTGNGDRIACDPAGKSDTGPGGRGATTAVPGAYCPPGHPGIDPRGRLLGQKNTGPDGRGRLPPHQVRTARRGIPVLTPGEDYRGKKDTGPGGRGATTAAPGARCPPGHPGGNV